MVPPALPSNRGGLVAGRGEKLQLYAHPVEVARESSDEVKVEAKVNPRSENLEADAGALGAEALGAEARNAEALGAEARNAEALGAGRGGAKRGSETRNAEAKR